MTVSTESTPLNPLVHNSPTHTSGPAGDAIGERVQPETIPSRFESKPTSFVGIAGPTLVYIGVEKREDFDKIAAPCLDHGQKADGHVLSKQAGHLGTNEVTVIFQHWLNQLTIDAMIADMQAKRK